MPYVPGGEAIPTSTYGALGPPQGAMGGLGRAATRQAKPTHVRVPVSTLIGLLLADAIKPVVPARPRVSNAAAAGLPGLANRVQRPQQNVGSLAALFNPRPTPRTGLNQRPSLGRYQNF